MELNIKSMVSERCKMIVREELITLGCKLQSLELGVVHIEGSLSPAEFMLLNENLRRWGWNLWRIKH